LSDLREKINQQNGQNIKMLNQRVDLNVRELDAYILSATENINSDEKQLRGKRSDLRSIEEQLEKPQGLSPEEVSQLENLQSVLTREIGELELKIQSAAQSLKNEKGRREAEITQLKDEVWDLTVNLPRLILEAENDLKEAFSAKREILQDALAGRKLKLSSLEEAISANEAAFRQNVSAYENRVEPERIRLMNACQESGTSCWGTGLIGEIWSNANNLISCARQLESDTLYYSGCEIASAYYKSNYNLLMNGISDQELGVLRRQNSSNQYMDLLKKFN